METTSAKSLYGVPARWGSLREMLYDVMSDMHRDWVQDYFLSPDMRDDARLLSSPGKLAQSCATTCCAYADPKYSHLDMFMVDLYVPAVTVDNITVGVSIESYAGEGAPSFLVRRKDRVIHFVRNSLSGAALALSFDDEVGIVEMGCYRPESLTRSLQLMVRLDSKTFMDAFTSRPGRIDYAKIEQGVLSVLLGDAVHEPKDPFHCECPSVNCSSCGSETGQLRGGGRNFKKLGLIGNWHTSASLTWYHKSAVVSSASVSTNFRRGPGVANCGIEEMIRWGMTDRLGRLAPTLKYVLSCPWQDLNLMHSGRVHEEQDKEYPIPIVPLPADHSEKKEDSIVDEIEKKRRDKILRRKIRKREAAHRSNAKRKERIRIARIAAESSTKL